MLQILKKILTEKHDIFFVTNPNIKDQDLHLSRKIFYFIFVIMQSICMEQCHSHLQCGYILIPIKKTFERFGTCTKNQNFCT